MAFLDSFKKNELGYLIILSVGVTIILLNNLVQFFETVVTNKGLTLLSLITFIIIIISNFMNKEEVLK